MICAIAYSIIIIGITIGLAVKKVKKEPRIICGYNCKTCKEKDVCGIRGKHENFK
ncbi:hypothetical protein [Clostridium botulinum]|uniref:hypothetical protein n=1 Tax=Clostridium botulinum TaxID=1491 RepID=UPI00178CF9B5|nr:hypothetical protein [Clostridium botulinum]MBY6799517.1 hypothetical protein [Clostridium botulinum]